jgi:glycosyltransferase involved in cell wall biosynthesis
VIPVLNEAATIELVLKSLTALDFQDLGLNKEVILVDGGSSDKTLDQAKLVRNVKVFSLPSDQFGRGAAMRLGVSKARGNLIVFFPGDNEYRPEDVSEVVRSLVRPGFRAVFGTRAVKCTDLSQSLKEIYGNNWTLYLTSKYGGMLLSVLTLLLYNRYVTDVLSSLKGYDARLLQSLDLESSGIDLETEIVSKLSRRREYMFEMPVEYKPRTRNQGKKIRTSDGLKALFSLIRFRLR